VEILLKMTGTYASKSIVNQKSEDADSSESLVPSYIVLPHEQ